MSAPTQELPSWLTLMTTTITDSGGNPLTTSTTLVFLPLTYYGPSIPLGPDWTYGGLTSPGPSETATETSATIPTTTTTPVTTIPTTTPATPSSTSAIPSSTSPLSSSSLSSLSTFSASTSHGSPTSTSTGIPAASGGLERGQLVGIIVGSILGAIAIFLFALVCCLSRRRRSTLSSRSLSAIDSEPVIINAEDARYSPRASGEEIDTLLQPSSSRRRSGQTGSLPSSSSGSGYGTLLDKPTLSMSETPIEEERYDRPLHPWQLHSLEEEEDSVLPQGEPAGHMTDFGPAMAMAHPPRLVGQQQSQVSIKTHRSSYPIDGDEPAELATARRVRVDGPRTSPETRNLPLEPADPGPSSRRRSGRGSGGLLGLTGLGGLGRFSWFNRRHSTTDRDLESGTALLADAPPEMAERRQSRLGANLGLGLTAEGDRPISSVSAKSTASEASVYHDAQSSLPITPGVTPPPRALASTSHGELLFSSDPVPGDVDPLDGSLPSISGTRTLSGDVDILDMPAPRGISPFGSSSSTTTPSIPEHVHGLPTPAAWNDTMGKTPSMGSFAGQSEGSTQVAAHGITIDVLEEAPPAAGDMWKAMASVVGLGSLGGAGTRTTFGLPRFVDPPDHTSEIGSLHSMRSHLSPNSSRSAGSAPASRRDVSFGSGSSHSHPRSKSTTSGSSLAHSGSISSHGHGRRAMSPALSAFGHYSPLNSPAKAHFSDASGVAIDDRRSPSNESQSPPLSPLLMSPWVGGLDQDWQAT